MHSKDTTTADAHRASGRSSIIVALAGGLILGCITTAAVGWAAMPGMMIVSQPSRLDFDQTVARLQEEIAAQGWTSPQTMDMQASLAKHGQDLPHRVKVIKLCHPQYASDVLTTDRYVSCLMPCSIAVWESDEGEVFVSKMNTGLMGKMFGGNIAAVMGTKVAKDEKSILSSVLQ